MPVIFFLVIIGAGFWAWRTGKLRGFTYEDGIAAAVFLLGLRLLTTGRIIIGSILLTGAMLWAAWRRKSPTPSMTAADARALLGVSANASLADIRDAHRRLIAKVHPDTGGSAELAHRVNLARDTLVAEMNRKTPRAS